jgi:hypothetical protein
MSSIVPPPPPREQLCNRYCSNKHTHRSRSPDGWDQIPRRAGGWACTSHPGVLGSIPKREEPGKTGRHPVLKYRVPYGSHAHSFVLGTAVINNNLGNSEPSRLPRVWFCRCPWRDFLNKRNSLSGKGSRHGASTSDQSLRPACARGGMLLKTLVTLESPALSLVNPAPP